jgi:hypothetical protein
MSEKFEDSSLERNTKRQKMEKRKGAHIFFYYGAIWDQTASALFLADHCV